MIIISLLYLGIYYLLIYIYIYNNNNNNNNNINIYLLNHVYIYISNTIQNNGYKWTNQEVSKRYIHVYAYRYHILVVSF